MAWLKIHNQSCILLIKQQKVLYTEKTKKQTKQNKTGKTKQYQTNNNKKQTIWSSFSIIQVSRSPKILTVVATL